MFYHIWLDSGYLSDQKLNSYVRFEIAFKSCYKPSMNNEENLYKAEFTPEAVAQIHELTEPQREKLAVAITVFERVGSLYKNINNLGDVLFELKPGNIRAFFKYDPNRHRIIIIGLVVLKKTGKTP